ncbi:MAG: hypothetical protein EAZ99_02795 [Alphaproteobacteria bacterium]|nr:PGPGW domain-containing protein [Alphaproteobacteria bacterium]TAD91592.1 MAG: hypothetical protein EAZ99_02795 [Alphaproteobacteria bacterium]
MRLKTKLYTALGWSIVALGVVVTPLPGPGGVFVIGAGVVVLLRHAPGAKRSFVKAQKRYPWALTPIRRALTFGWFGKRAGNRAVRRRAAA